MPRPLLPIFLLLAALASASADPPPPEELKVQRTTTTIDYLVSLQGCASSWTVFSDGRIQHLDHPLDGQPRLRSGKLPAKVLAALLARAKEQGLDKARFTQVPKPGAPPILSEGVTRLSLRGNVLSSPELARPNAATKALCARIEAFAKDLARTFEPHLDKRHPGGTYVYVHVFSKKDHAKLGKLGDELETVDSPRLRAALETPGLFVRLEEGETVQRGQRNLVQGRAIMWNTREVADPQAR